MGDEVRPFHEDQDGIRYRDHLSLAARAFVLLMAVAMMAMSATFMFMGHRGEPGWNLLLTVLLMLAPLAVGAVFLRMGLEPAKEAWFDPRTRTVHMTLRGPFGRRRLAWPFGQVRSLVLKRHRSQEEDDRFILHMKIDGRAREYMLGVFVREEEADFWRARIESLLSA